MRTRLLLICLLFVGCKTKYIPVERVVRDSVAVHDTVIQVKLKPFKEVVLVDDTISLLDNEVATSEAKITNNKLYHSLEIKDTPIKVETKFITEYKTIKEPVPYEVEKIVKVEKKLTWWEKKKILFGEIAFIVLLSVIAYKIFSRRFGL